MSVWCRHRKLSRLLPASPFRRLGHPDRPTDYLYPSALECIAIIGMGIRQRSVRVIESNLREVREVVSVDMCERRCDELLLALPGIEYTVLENIWNVAAYGYLIDQSGGTMTYGVFGSGILSQTPVKHKIFVSYHHGGDQAYYNAFSKAFHDTYEVIFDNSLERQIDSDNVDYVMRQIRENYITGSSCTIVLVGKDTWGRKFVDWEIKATLDKEHGLIGVYLPTAPRDPTNNKITVPSRLHPNIQSGFALWLSWQDIVASAAQLDRYIADAKSRNTKLIVNPHDVRLRNA